ncbi:hypothetical protein TNCT_600351 [Trichonephila clavata]|uniref:Uncharacterized protein n=1 Tax=Trichonephila clavata TaxID=2740835 RepID=A0A8X6KPP9_TRICU|nr:hypothetical protein TNCT_600351 [Trichonephila clavata]
MEERKRKHLSEIKESAWSKRLRPETSTDEDEEDISVFLPATRNSTDWSNATYSGSVKNLRRVTPKSVSGSFRQWSPKVDSNSSAAFGNMAE